MLHEIIQYAVLCLILSTSFIGSTLGWKSAVSKKCPLHLFKGPGLIDSSDKTNSILELTITDSVVTYNMTAYFFILEENNFAYQN